MVMVYRWVAVQACRWVVVEAQACRAEGSAQARLCAAIGARPQDCVVRQTRHWILPG